MNTLTEAEAIERGYAGYNDFPHLCLDIPATGLTISTKLPDGTKATFSFVPDGKGNILCIDAQHVKPGSVWMNGGSEVPVSQVINFNKGQNVFRGPTTCVTLLTADHYYHQEDWKGEAWGIAPVDPKAKAWWGARAILHSRRAFKKKNEFPWVTEILTDRTSTWLAEGEKAMDHKDLFTWINDVGLHLAERKNHDPRKGNLFYMEDGDFRGLCDTRGSAGYLYLGFWKV